jgi:toxin ParE1/3/4
VRIIWTPEAERDRQEIVDYVGGENLRAAVELEDRIDAAVGNLAEFPRMGKAGKVPGTRELFPNENYRIVYEFDGTTVWILAVVHTSRRWPPHR